MNIIIALTKIANRLDKLGLYKEANQIDILLKEAVDMSPEEYEKYYGRPKYGPAAAEKLDINLPEDYKKYFGKEMPIEKSKKPISNYKVGDEVIVEKVPDRYKHRSPGYAPAMGQILDVLEVRPNSLILGPDRFELGFDEVSLYDPSKKHPGDIYQYDTLSEIIQDMATIIDDMVASMPVEPPRLKINPPGMDAVIVALQFGTTTLAENFMKELPSMEFKMMAGGADRVFRDDERMAYSGDVLVSQSPQAPNVVRILIHTNAPLERARKDLIEAVGLARYYLDFWG